MILQFSRATGAHALAAELREQKRLNPLAPSEGTSLKPTFPNGRKWPISARFAVDDAHAQTISPCRQLVRAIVGTFARFRGSSGACVNGPCVGYLPARPPCIDSVFSREGRTDGTAHAWWPGEGS